MKMIVIIVDDDLERPRQNANSFSRLNQVITYYYSNSRLYKQHQIGKKIIWTEATYGIKDIKDKIDLAIIHNTHKLSWEQFCKSLQIELTSSTLLIRYSGAYNNNLVIQNEDWITRSINLDTAITQSEAEDIIKYANHCQRNDKENYTKPLILSQLSFPIYLCSLSILAQGYLISHCRLQEGSFNINESYDSVNYSLITNRVILVQKKISDGDHELNKNDVMKIALEQMGWNTFRDSSNYAEIIHTDISEKKSDTEKTSWWLELFAPKTIDEIHDQIVKEWNELKYGKVCRCIDELIDAFKNSTTIDDPIIVANAYLAISNRLAQE
jgi:hypothetical protein